MLPRADAKQVTMCRFVLREDADDVALGQVVGKSSCRNTNPIHDMRLASDAKIQVHCTNKYPGAVFVHVVPGNGLVDSEVGLAFVQLVDQLDLC